MIFHKHPNPRFHDRWWAKMIQLSRKHYSHEDVTFHPTPYKRILALKNIYNNTNFVYTSMHEYIYMDMVDAQEKKGPLVQ